MICDLRAVKKMNKLLISGESHKMRAHLVGLVFNAEHQQPKIHWALISICPIWRKAGIVPFAAMNAILFRCVLFEKLIERRERQ